MKWKSISHTADHAFRVYGKDIDELYYNSFQALVESILGKIPPKTGKIIEYRIRLAETDPTLTIIDLLREVHYQITVENKLPVDLKILEKNGSEIYFQVDLMKANYEIAKYIDIKAVTYHDLKLRKTASGLSIDIVCDV